MVDRWAFHAEKLQGVTAFKVPQLPRAFTFLTKQFVDQFTSAGLTGLDPREVWQRMGE